MRTHKGIALFCLLGAMFFGVSGGAVLVAHTVSTYSGTCDKLDGFPGLLQSAGFVPVGNCKFINGKCPGPAKEACAVNGKSGHCVAQVVNDHAVCICVKDKISR